METIFEKMILVEIGATQRRIEAITNLRSEKNVLLRATYSGVLIGLENALAIYKESLQIDIE